MTSVIVLAAGNGSRLKTKAPKILYKIGGLALLDHVLRCAKAISADNIVAVVKPNFDMKQLKFGDGVIAAPQEAPIGSCDAVMCGMRGLESVGGEKIAAASDENTANNTDDDWVFVLYADVPLVQPKTLKSMLEMAKSNDKNGVVVLAMSSEGAKNLGKLEAADEDGTIKAIVEAKDADKYAAEHPDKPMNLLPLCNCGLLVRKSLLRKLMPQIKPSPVTGEIYITEIVRLAYEDGYVCRYFESDRRELSGANTLAEMAALERNFQDMTREKFMDNGVRLIAPETVFFSYDTEIDPDVTVQPYVVFGEGVRIGAEAVVGPFCVIEGAQVKGAKVGAFCVLEEAKISDTAQVGPFSRLRPGAEIGKGAKIGNFVEIKKSIISEKTKVNHLTYIGDSFIDENTNIGAGTITCNYDGVNKHKTIIGKNVFVGSNTALVAPVEVHDNAVIGAGSVITADVGAGDLAVARGRQRNIENWKAKTEKTK